MLKFVGGLSVGYAALAIAVLLVLLSVWSLQKPALNMPPGPTGYPFIGILLDVSRTPWEDFLRISKKHGPIFTFKLGKLRAVVVNNLELAKEGLLKKQVEFAGRPVKLYSLNLVTDGGKGILFGNYGPDWKIQRKIGHAAARTYAMGDNIEGVIHDVYPIMERLINKRKSAPFDPKEDLHSIVHNIVFSVLFGCRYSIEDEEFQTLKGLSRSLKAEFAKIRSAEFLPGVQYIMTPCIRRLKRYYKDLMAILYRKLKEHRDNFDPDSLKDLIDFFLNSQKEDFKQENKDAQIVEIVYDVFFAATDTSIYTMDWAIVFMATHPEIQVKVHREICDLIGGERYPRLTDQNSLPYTSATMREIMRMGSVVPAFPHSATCDSELGGYFIPKNTTVFFNMYAVNFDPNEWENPQNFLPDRFLDPDGNLLPKPAAMMPFGVGRRVCMGDILAKSIFFLLFTFFFQCYRVSTIPGTPVPGAETMEREGTRAPKPYSVAIEQWE